MSGEGCGRTDETWPRAVAGAALDHVTARAVASWAAVDVHHDRALARAVVAVRARPYVAGAVGAGTLRLTDARRVSRRVACYLAHRRHRVLRRPASSVEDTAERHRLFVPWLEGVPQPRDGVGQRLTTRRDESEGHRGVVNVVQRHGHPCHLDAELVDERRLALRVERGQRVLQGVSTAGAATASLVLELDARLRVASLLGAFQVAQSSVAHERCAFVQ